MPWTILIILNLETLTSAWPLQPSLLPCLLLLHPAVTFHLFIYPGWWPVIMFFWVHPKLDTPWPQDFLDIQARQLDLAVTERMLPFGLDWYNYTRWAQRPRWMSLRQLPTSLLPSWLAYTFCLQLWWFPESPFWRSHWKFGLIAATVTHL